MVKVKKSDLTKLLKERTEEFLTYGGEVVRYASPSNPTPIKTGSTPIIPTVNLRAEEWEKFISELESGTYVPERELQYKDPEPHRWVSKPRRDDGRGYKTIKGYGPKWR